jgi:hypothetical protein
MDGTRVKARRRSLSMSYYDEDRKWGNVGCAGACEARSRVVGWNEGMARRMGSFIDNYRQDFRVMVTLTYPATWPRSGPAVKAHLRAFTERVRRLGWFDEASWVWFLEFQDRGAPHFHLLCTEFIGMHWVAEAWASITGGDVSACTRVEGLRDPESAGAYARKYARKSEQKAVPVGFESVGRMWGCSGARVLRGVPRVPHVAADIEGASPHLVAKAVRAFDGFKQIRMVETLSGYSVYGQEKEVQRLWLYLLDVFGSADLIEKVLDGSRPKPLAASPDWQSKPAKTNKRFAQPLPRKLTVEVKNAIANA